MREDGLMVQQPSLFDLAQLKSKVITRRGDLAALIAGFPVARAITYVASPDVVLDVLDAQGFETLELVLGDSLTAIEPESLRLAGTDLVERPARGIEDGRLAIYVPRKTIHTKLCLLTRDRTTRVIMTSANLTWSAREATRQTNYAWYVDLTEGDAWLEQVRRDYDAHKRECRLFMDDLLRLFREKPELPRVQIVEAWLSGADATEPASPVSQVLGELTGWVLDPTRATTEPVFTLQLPKDGAARKQTEKALARIGASVMGDVARVDRASYLTYAEQTLQLPMLTVDIASRQVRLAMRGELATLTAPLAAPNAVDAALGELEGYIESVDWGKAPAPLLAKTSMYEATLYMLAAPFANEQMRIMRQRHGALERRGPKMLYLYGPSSNGKTTFLRFALFLLTGQRVQPLASTELTKSRVQSASLHHTSFPLVFDDVNPSQRSSFEDIVKSHWESWWTADGVSPQIVIASNRPTLPEWAKTRVKRIDFDVHFAPSERNKARLAKFFETASPLFRWFSWAYLDNLQVLLEPRDDELHLAREVTQRMYAHAGRKVPEFFPARPLEEIYDPGSIRWRDLIHRKKQATLRRERDRLTIEFTDDLQHHEITPYLGLVPQTLKYERSGRKLIVENPAEFERWLGDARPSILDRVRGVFRRSP
ncbi:MAG: hypothetical protein ACT4PJ_14630 [Gemmatimonadaceae bacterium]